MKIAITLFVLFFAGFNLFAQDDWLCFPQNNSDTLSVEQVSLNYSSKKGKVTLHEDARLKKIGEFVREGESSIGGVKINGYRIVIFFDQDKSAVSQQKANFLARYSGHKVYIDYVAPNYRVRVGNFRTKIEAEGLKAELLNYFPTAVVVEDNIQLPELPEAIIGE